MSFLKTINYLKVSFHIIKTILLAILIKKLHSIPTYIQNDLDPYRLTL
jgi:hypothetical protein